VARPGTAAIIGALVRTILSIALSGLALSLAACGGDGEDDGRTTIAAGTAPVADLVRQVAGESADVRAVLAAGADPHEYEPRPSDARALAEADLVVRAGGEVDAWLEELLEASGGEAERLVLLDAVLADAAPADASGQTGPRAEPAHEGEPDPHWWLDPRNALIAVDAIAARLAELDPENARRYERNARAYAARLRALDRSIARCFAALTPQQRQLVTAHESLGWFARRYGLRLAGAAIPALSTQAQASAGETAELVELIEARRVPAVFPEAGVSAELERALASEAGVRLGDPLYIDTLGEPGSGAETYAGAMAANAETLAAGLSGRRAACSVDPG